MFMENEPPIYRDEKLSDNINVYESADQTEAWLIFDEFGPVIGSSLPLPAKGVWDFRSFSSREEAEEAMVGVPESYEIRQLQLDKSDRPVLEEKHELY